MWVTSQCSGDCQPVISGRTFATIAGSQRRLRCIGEAEEAMAWPTGNSPDHSLMPRDPVPRLLGMDGTDPARDALTAGIVSAGWTALAAVVLVLRPALFLTGDLASQEAEALARLSWVVLVLPAGLYVYFWLPRSLASLVSDLVDRGVIVRRDNDSSESVENLAAGHDRVSYSGSSMMAIGVAVLTIGAYWLYKLMGLPEDTTPGSRAQMILDLLVYTPPIYAAALTVSRLVAGIVITNELFRRYAVAPHPLHPDGAGGLSPLGNRVALLVVAATLIGAAVVIINLLGIRAGRPSLASPETLLTAGGLFVLAPIVLWGWLRTPHRAMLEARDRVLMPISERFEQLSLRPLPARAPSADLRESTDLLTELQRREQVIRDSYPTWPIRTTALRVAWLAVAAPYAGGLVTVALDAILG